MGGDVSNDEHPERRPKDFAGRFRRLIAVMRPPGQAPLSDRAIAARVRAHGGSISPAYVAALRRGTKVKPSLDHTQQIAQAFGVSAGYFCDPEVYERVSQELDRIEEINQRGGDSAQLVELATRAASLRPSDRDALAALVRRELAARKPAPPAEPS